MTLCHYRPAMDTRVPRLGLSGPGVYGLESADIDALNARIPGLDGGPCLVPVADPTEVLVPTAEPPAAPKSKSAARGK